MKFGRCYNELLKKSTLINVNVQNTRDKSTKIIEKSVVISKSQDIYTNLALEHWYYKNWNFTNKHLLMLWTNNPCVVIGKFQNPWLECNVPQLKTLTPDGIKLARRNSGGGTVYHDPGNLNLTFFTFNTDLNRKHNLEMIKNAIFKRFGLEIIVSDRDDLIYDDYKLSGTAARYTRTTSYHHCTLLVNADKNILSKSLQKPNYSIKTTASQSTRSPIKNLNELNQKITIPELIKSISKEYLTTLPYIKGDFNVNLISHHNIHHITPTEEDYPELLDFRDEMKSSEWIFGTCPDFTATKLMNIDESTQIKINFEVVKGIIIDVNVEDNLGKKNFDKMVYSELFKERKFDENLFEEIKDCLNKELNRNVVKKLINNF